MKRNTGIMRVTVAVIMVAIAMPMVAAQQPNWQCWGRLQACERNARSAEQFGQMCCPVVVNQMIGMDTGCFCLIGTTFPQNPAFAQQIADLLSFCGAPAFDTICPGSPPSPSGTPSAPPMSSPPSPSGTPSAPPMSSPASPSGTPSAPPMSSPASPSGTPTAPPMSSPPSPSGTPSAPPTDSPPSPSGTPSAPPTSPSSPSTDITPSAPPPGTDTSTTDSPPTSAPPPGDAPPTTDEVTAPSDDTEADDNAANKMVVTGSLSSLIILFTYFLFN